jgi:hypothetical protein
MDLQAATLETFAPFVGTIFSMEEGAEEVAFSLAEAKLLPTPPYISGGRQPFRLHFTSTPPLLSQGIYRLTHAVCTPLDIFLVPIAGDANLFTYEAIFN